MRVLVLFSNESMSTILIFWVVLFETSSDNYPDTFIRHSVAWDGMVKPPSHWVRNINLYTLTKHNKQISYQMNNDTVIIQYENKQNILHWQIFIHELSLRIHYDK